MKHLLTFILLIICFYCNAQEANKIQLLRHSPSDTAYTIVKPDYTIYCYLHEDSIPLKFGTEIWIKPNKTNHTYTIKAINCKAIYAENATKVCVIPYADTFTINVFKEGSLIDTLPFKTVITSNPIISISTKDGFLHEDTDSIIVKIDQPNIKLRRVYPKDCRYVADSLIILIKRNDKEIYSIKTRTFDERRPSLINSEIALDAIDLKSGDEVIITAINVKRINFINQAQVIADKVLNKFTIK